MKPALGKKGGPLAVAMCRVGPERKTLGSGLNAANIGAEIDVIKPALPAQTSRSDCYSLRFRSFVNFVPLSPCSFATSHFLPFSHRAVIHV
jgi:hypothetical protein